MAVVGRDCDRADAADSRSSTFSANATMRFAIPSKTSVTLTMALLARRLSRPAIAIKAYVLLAPRDRGSCKRKMYAIVYPATGSPNISGPDGFPHGSASHDKVRMHVRRNKEYVAGD